MNHSVIIAKNVWIEDIFNVFYSSVIQSGGDGASVICCSNPLETADNFYQWCKDDRSLIHHPKDQYGGPDGETIVNFHDNNENFMFCDQVIYLSDMEITFVVEEDCPSYICDFICKKL